MKNSTTFFLLCTIFLVGLTVRAYRLGENPAGFFADEAAIGYNAYTLLTKGVDEYGKTFPFFFQSFGDYRLPVPIYSNIPLIAIFGLNEFAVRFTAAFFGTLTIIVLFFLSRKLFASSTIALLSAFFLAISPWHIHLSRFGAEYIYFPFWFSLGIYLFLVGLEKRKILLLSFFVFGISLYTYYPALFTVPLFVGFLFVVFHKKLLENKKNSLLGSGIFFLMIIPFLIGIQNGTILTRWQKVSVVRDTNNKSLILKVFKNYVSHFTPTFLFTKGDIDYPEHFITRFSVRGMGELYWVQLPLLILGMLALLRKAASKNIFLIIIIWFLVYPLGSSFARIDAGSPFAFRSIFGVVPFQMLSAVGLVFLLSFLRNRFLLTVFSICLVFIVMVSFSYYLQNYFTKYPLYSSDFWGWQFGPRNVMQYFLATRNAYDEFFLMGNFNSPEIFVKFYDPENVCQDRCQIGGVERFGNDRKQLFAVGADRMNEIDAYNLLPREIIYYPNNTPAFYIGELRRK